MTFAKGDYVVRLLPQRKNKLGASVVGPYMVLEQVKENSYKIKHYPKGDVVEAHVQTLKPFDISRTPDRYLLDLLDNFDAYVVEAIRSHEVIDKEYHFTVKWKDYPESSNTVEPLANLKHVPVLQEYLDSHGLALNKQGRVIKRQ